MICRAGLRVTALAIALTALAGCDGDSDPILRDSPASADSRVARDLDALAMDTGALPDAEEVNPAGRYARRYEGGSDRLCMIPEENARGRYKFGAETRIGRDEYCAGTGRAELSENKLLLRFEGTGKDCQIVARYEGDKIVLPGSIDGTCAALCSSRGSFSGVSFPRFDRNIAEARQMRDKDGKLLCR